MDMLWTISIFGARTVNIMGFLRSIKTLEPMRIQTMPCTMIINNTLLLQKARRIGLGLARTRNIDYGQIGTKTSYAEES